MITIARTFREPRPSRQPQDLLRQIADSIQVTPCDRDWPPGDLGCLTARRHPTGWYISARSRPDLGVDEGMLFQQFVTQRTWSLLAEGPAPGMWLPGEREDEWQTFSTSPELSRPQASLVE